MVADDQPLEGGPLERFRMVHRLGVAAAVEMVELGRVLSENEMKDFNVSSDLSESDSAASAELGIVEKVPDEDMMNVEEAPVHATELSSNS